MNIWINYLKKQKEKNNSEDKDMAIEAESREDRAYRIKHGATKNNYWVLNPSIIYPAWFQTCLAPVTLLIPFYVIFRMRMYIIYQNR